MCIVLKKFILLLLHSIPFLHEIYAISYMWVAAIGFLITLLVGVIVSRATGGNDVLDADLFSTWIRLPSSEETEKHLSTEKVGMKYLLWRIQGVVGVRK